MDESVVKTIQAIEMVGEQLYEEFTQEMFLKSNLSTIQLKRKFHALPIQPKSTKQSEVKSLKSNVKLFS